MPKPVKGEVPLSLNDGREFVLVLDFEALVEAESAYGKPLALMMNDAKAGFVGAVRAMLYGALRAHHPDITLREASALFIGHTDEVTAALEGAAEAAMPDASAEGNAPSPRRGKTSGGSGAKPGSSRKRSGKQPRARSA